MQDANSQHTDSPDLQGQAGPIPQALDRGNGGQQVIVIGAGISGLCSAWFLQQQGYDVLVLEASACVGGNLQTVKRDGCQFERGPNSFMNNRPAMAELIKGAGLEQEIVPAKAAAQRRFVGKYGALVALPTNPLEGITTNIMTWPGKLRVAWEPFVGRSRTEESIAQFVTRRLGKQMFDWLIDPFISGVFAGDPHKLSVQAAVPRLYALEQQHGSLIRGALAHIKARRQATGPKLDGAMMTFKHGLHQLMTSLADQLLNPVQLNTQVESVSYSQEHGYMVRSGDAIWQAQKLVLAVPAKQVARLIEDLPTPDETQLAHAQRQLRSIYYPPVATISMAFKKQQIQHPLDGFGALFPSKENKQILGALFPSSIFSGRAQPDQHVLTVFVGGGRGSAAMQLSAAERLALVLQELDGYVGIKGQPLWSEESYWPAAIPQYEVGHLQKVAEVDQALAHLSGLYLRSNWRDGVALGDCVESAQALALQVVADDAGDDIYA
ncbi:MAG: protoporphyrinogen oxidase [Gammaproteobacteria bacterium]|jgi:oxygen-dependent protoporphyrinogen oxidase|nr:protoporphyrinogen oxidase [Gammaproteobacteria bacterium]